MKVAILIAGYLRTFKDNFSNLKSFLRNFEQVDVYIHLTENESKEDKYLNSFTDIDDIRNLLNPKCLLCEPNQSFSTNKTKNNLYNYWFKYHKINEIKNENERIEGSYDLIIKWRPDFNLISNIDFKDLSNIRIPRNSKIDKSKLKNQSDSFICDIFAFGNSQNMNQYFDLYNHLESIIKKYDTLISETILYHYLNDFEISYNTEEIEYSVLLSKCNVFALAGDSGSGKSTLSKILETYFENSFTLECDRYHKWERGNENWKKMTHLNPDANYLAKMSEDIFDLKIGKTVYQVDYDHSNGKFTQPQKIESSDNLIVCGLHSLYNSDNQIYNLKIFMNTDKNLKYSWKSKRDINKRGYTKEKIFEQIKSRESDYQEYIEPQSHLSDIIINFYTDDIFNFDDVDKELFLKLKLFIRKEFEIDYIKSSFEEQNIIFRLETDENFSIFNFESFQNHNLVLNSRTNDFYDYIIFIILNLKKIK